MEFADFQYLFTYLHSETMLAKTEGFLMPGIEDCERLRNTVSQL